MLDGDHVECLHCVVVALQVRLGDLAEAIRRHEQVALGRKVVVVGEEVGLDVLGHLLDHLDLAVDDRAVLRHPFTEPRRWKWFRPAVT